MFILSTARAPKLMFMLSSCDGWIGWFCEAHLEAKSGRFTLNLLA